MKQKSEVSMMRPKRNLRSNIGRLVQQSLDWQQRLRISWPFITNGRCLWRISASAEIFYKSQARDALSTNGNVPSMGGALFFFCTTARQQRTTCTKCSTAKCRLLDDYKRNETPRHETTSGVCLFSVETDDICLNNK